MKLTPQNDLVEIPGFRGYFVNIFGEVFSGPKVNRPGIRLLSINTIKNGYQVVFISGRPRFLHRMLALALIPNPDNKPCVNHKNGHKSDNRLENLEWVTHSENHKHAFNTGLRKPKRGPNSHVARLSQQDVDFIRSNKHHTLKATAEKFNISLAYVSLLRNPKKYPTIWPQN